MRRIAGRIAYRAVRNQGTIGGSVALADPAADWPACLIALRRQGARRRAKRRAHRRRSPNLIEDIYTTTLAPDEIIVGFEIPRLEAAARSGFAKVARKTGAFAMSLAIAVVNDGARAARVVLGGAGDAGPLTLRPRRPRCCNAGGCVGSNRCATRSRATCDDDRRPRRLSVPVAHGQGPAGD